MKEQYNINTPISELTVGELISIVRAVVNEVPQQSNTAYGLQGLADLFGVSITQAKRIKASGIVAGAISQSGRTIIIDKQKALDLYSKSTHGRY